LRATLCTFAKKTRMTRIILNLVLGIIIISGCGKKNLRDYYFPLKALKDKPLVYEYRYSLPDTAFTVYWYYQTVVKGDSVYFVGTCYSAQFEQMLLMQEERVSNGMKLKGLTYFGINAEGQSVSSQATIEGGAVFPFEVADDKSVFINVIKYHDPKDSAHVTTLTRNRRFLKETSYDYQGQKYAAATFDMKEEQSETDPKKGGWAHVSTIQEVYAKDLGLVYSRRDAGNGTIVESRLVTTYPMSQLEEKFKEHLKVPQGQ
jgi:hypothetical protein